MSETSGLRFSIVRFSVFIIKMIRTKFPAMLKIARVSMIGSDL